MNFSTIKAITIPEGSVKQITDSNGVVLWKQPSQEGWHTIWEGSKTITDNRNKVTGDVSNFAQSVSGLGTTPTIRITFTMSSSSISSSYPLYYYNNGTRTKYAPSSPMTLTIGSNSKLIGICRGIYGNTYREVYISRTTDKTNGRVKFNLSYDGTSSAAVPGVTSLTVTKIEQYY